MHGAIVQNWLSAKIAKQREITMKRIYMLLLASAALLPICTQAHAQIYLDPYSSEARQRRYNEAQRMYPWASQAEQRIALEKQLFDHDYNAWQEQRLRSAQQLQQPARLTTPQQALISANMYGQFHPVVAINNVVLTMMADTGAADMVLTVEDTQKIGIDLQTLRFTEKIITANGSILVAPFWLREVNVSGIVLYDVRALCCINGLKSSLLGMSVLGRLNVRIANGFMYLLPK
jgi:clan AA aspartic protease (TIGR02281 family)